MQTFKIDEKEYSLSDLLSRKSEKLVRFETIEFLDNIWETVSDNDKSLLNQEQGLIEKILVPWFFNETTRHNAYFNDAFYLTNRFGIQDYYKRKAGVVALWNRRHKYFRWITHHDFDNSKLLNSMGLISRSDAEGFGKNQGNYVFMPSKIYSALIRNLGLTQEELCSAHLICQSVCEKERTNNKNSGMYDGLPVADYPIYF